MACYQNLRGIFPNFFSLTKLTVCGPKTVSLIRRAQHPRNVGLVGLWEKAAVVGSKQKKLKATINVNSYQNEV